MTNGVNTNVIQSTVQNTQNNDIDVVQTYKDYITGGNTANDNSPGANVGIDDIRVSINVSVLNNTTTNLISSLNIDPGTGSNPTSASTPNTTTPAIKAQESRCHAFYRIIGFPVVSSDKSSYYNPGMDIVKQVDATGTPITRQITLATKISIASAVGTQFEAISTARETWAANTAKIFANLQSVEAGVLALSSGTYSGDQGLPNLRTFSASFTNGNSSADPFDFKITDQSYSAATASLIGINNTSKIPNIVPFTQYMDNNGDTLITDGTNTNPIFSQHQHIIVPFMVDPRIDFSIWSSDSPTAAGTCQRIAVPFVPNASFLKAGSTSTAMPPLIEKVITDRISQLNNTDAGVLATNLIQSVQSIKSIQTFQIAGTPISGFFTSGGTININQQASLVQAIANIQALVSKLVQSMNIIQKAQAIYYWLPAPAVTGPEGGSSVLPVTLNQQLATSNLFTQSDTDIILNQLQVFFSNLNSTVAQATATPDKGGYTPPSPKITFDSSSSSSQGNISENTQDTLSKKRDKQLNNASGALQVVEMIMGEFSGLGLCDIYAIVSALYIMPIGSLVGLLDSDAQSRAATILNVEFEGGLAANDIDTSMTDLASTVYSLYQIMDQIFLDVSANNSSQSH